MQRLTPFAGSALVLMAAALVAAGGQTPRQPAGLSARASSPPWASEDSMHAYFLDRFEASDGLGARRTVGPLMTLTDAMTVSVRMPLDEGAVPVPRAYRVEAFELIGVAKRATPVAFVVQRHRGRGVPATSERPAPAELEMRPLTTFERYALGRLQEGEEIIAQPEGKALSVVGAVRASAFCVGCHAGYAVGDVLGALSYHLALIEGE